MRSGDLRAAACLFASTPESRLALIRALWPQVVGEQVARHAEVASLTDRLLCLRVADARWRKVLPRMRREILARLSQDLGSLAPRQIGLIEGPLTGGATRASEHQLGRAHPRKEPIEPASAALRHAALSIADPGLRSAFLAAAERYLAAASLSAKSEPSD